MKTPRTAQTDTRRRQIAADLDSYRRGGGEIQSLPSFVRAGTRGDIDNSHLFGYRKR